MKRFTCFGCVVAAATLSLSLSHHSLSIAAEPPESTVIDQVVSLEESFTAAFNEGQVEKLVAMFLADGEWIDDEGVVHRGHQELKTLFDGYFDRFPDAQLAVEIESRATAPDGLLGSATVTITRTSPDQFRMVGTDRIIGGQRADDFDVSVTRAPPQPAADDRSAPDR